METGSSLLRGAELLSCGLVTGSLFFRAWIADSRRLRRLSLAVVVVALVMVAAWFLVRASAMAGSWAPSDLTAALTVTRLGEMSMTQFAVLVALVVLALGRRVRIASILAFVLPLAFTLESHAAARESYALLASLLDFSHGLAASLWIGGLLALILWIAEARGAVAAADTATTSSSSARTVLKFSRLALACTAAIAAAGIALALLYGVPPGHPWSTTYGKLVCAKVLLLLLALGAAAVNHFVHLSKLRAGAKAPGAISAAIRREATIEFVLVVIIFGVAGFLTQTSPM